MNTFNALNLTPAKAICYSGFRDGQAPGQLCPSYEQVKEDLLILQKQWKYLRLYDVDQHGESVLEVIRNEKLDLKVMMGAFISAEMNNFGCPWGGIYSQEQLEENQRINHQKIEKLVQLAHQYRDIVFSLSVGNEACVGWTDHFVPEKRVVEYVKMVQEKALQPVTFCESYAVWLNKPNPLAKAVDFISLHTYPVWEYKHIYESIEYTKKSYYSVARMHPSKPVVITEAGWATNSNGRGISPENVSEENQKIYFENLMEWAEKENILTFFFEAFDESWKGSPDPLEPEKHWGVYKIDRTPKKVMAKQS